MSLKLAQELWGGPGQTVPTVFTSNRLSGELLLDTIAADVTIARVEVSAVLLRWLGGVIVFPSINNNKKLDVTARATETKVGDVYELACSALARTIGNPQFQMTAIDPYLRIDAALSPGDQQIYRDGTIVFPYAATLIGDAPDLVSFDYSNLRGSGNYERVAPTFVYEVDAAIAALGSKLK